MAFNQRQRKFLKRSDAKVAPWTLTLGFLDNLMVPLTANLNNSCLWLMIPNDIWLPQTRQISPGPHRTMTLSAPLIRLLSLLVGRDDSQLNAYAAG